MRKFVHFRAFLFISLAEVEVVFGFWTCGTNLPRQLVTVTSTWREAHNHMALARARALARSVDRAAAQRCAVVRVPRFLDDAELAELDQLQRAHHTLRGGPPAAARHGWWTTYLNADGLFRANAPILLAKVSRPLSRKRVHVCVCAMVLFDRQDRIGGGAISRG